MASPSPTQDLSFQPADAAAARVLDQSQIAFYNREGYLKPFRVFDAAQAHANRIYFDDLLAAMKLMNDGRDTYAINGYHSRCEGIHRIVTHPDILDLVQDIIGPDIVCWGTHFFCKMPRDPKAVPWHQDASYWPFTPARTVTVWLAIDDADVANACMHVIPRTHVMGHLAWKPTRQDAVLNQEIPDVQTLGSPVPIELAAGEISLHADMIVHGSTPNRSDRRRCGLTMRYCPPTVSSSKPDWQANAILCRGKDPTGAWGFPPAPRGNDLSPRNKPKSIGGN